MEAAREKKTQAKHVWIKKLQKLEAEAKAHVAIITKDEFDKEIERDKPKKSIRMFTINHN